MTDHESRDEGINRAWVFLGGCLAAVGGLFVAAIVSDTLASLEGSQEREEEAQLALPEGETRGS
ncbi:hypothetical protein RVX_R08140 [Nitratidesulfovibrio sp. HK-II]|uniref:hypothetical protein n=1 Tax=Nitratidesulfovibrio sp. HK-II TaxID=2009266 RepID=UPI000E2EBDE7|nr:hypothetical protein [Nitratidesulfovibrio sp. HK-II]